MRASVSILIPTFNQPQALYNTLYSIVKWTHSAYRIYVVDNSVDKYAKNIAARVSQDIVVLEATKNLGWMGGINLGISKSSESFVLFLNDDIKILNFDQLWLQKLLEGFSVMNRVGAVVPTSNAVMGHQNFLAQANSMFELTPIVSGLCLLTKRSILNEVGGLDETLSGGDDLDFSIRLKSAKYNMLIRSDVFIYHFGSLTGQSMHGSYWNSPEYSDALNRDLIKKHGFKVFSDMFTIDTSAVRTISDEIEWEKDAMLKYCVGKGCEVGCGDRKLRSDITGIDITPKGERGTAGCQIGRKSEADISVSDYKLPLSDNSQEFVASRHVLEHIVNDVGALTEWVRVLKHSGLLIITLPNEDVVDGLPLDPTHKHTYTVESLRTKLDLLCNYEVMEVLQKDISFVFVARVIK